MKNNIDDFPLFLNAKNISEIMRVSLRKAYEIMEYSDFPLIKIGRCKRVEREGFFEWLEQQKLNSK
ncbi:DNA-binding protein [Neobacillus sp. NPDC093182]|uniref:DNA-binding protein n=1 Tax=Neobacillus sp. NPDC093182 TaxID=3364297 RepID=UPI0038203C75